MLLAQGAFSITRRGRPACSKVRAQHRSTVGNDVGIVNAPRLESLWLPASSFGEDEAYFVDLVPPCLTTCAGFTSNICGVGTKHELQILRWGKPGARPQARDLENVFKLDILFSSTEESKRHRVIVNMNMGRSAHFSLTVLCFFASDLNSLAPFQVYLQAGLHADELPPMYVLYKLRGLLESLPPDDILGASTS